MNKLEKGLVRIPTEASSHTQKIRGINAAVAVTISFVLWSCAIKDAFVWGRFGGFVCNCAKVKNGEKISL